MEFEITLSDIESSTESESAQCSSGEYAQERFDFDEYENEGFLNDENRCLYCHQAISMMPFTINERTFCDVICAHLFNLKNHIVRMNYDKRQYDTYYKNGLLSNSALNAYRLLRNIDLPLLPITVDTEEEPEISKNKYSTAIIAYVNQSMS